MKKDILEEFNIKNYIYILKSKLCYILSSLFKIFWENGICLVGVDGSGKSTTVYNLEQILIPHVKIQYMGFKDWELKFVRNHFENTKDTKIYKLQSIIYVYIEMWYRYIKSRFSRKLVIYDRFVDEAYINASGLSKKIYTILYKYLFPKPKQYIYLYCDLDTSLSRKDDILDKEQFRNMKDRFDLIFLNKEMIPCYSSDELSTEMILADIIKLLNRKYQKFLI